MLMEVVVAPKLAMAVVILEPVEAVAQVTQQLLDQLMVPQAVVVEVQIV